MGETAPWPWCCCCCLGDHPLLWASVSSLMKEIFASSSQGCSGEHVGTLGWGVDDQETWGRSLTLSGTQVVNTKGDMRAQSPQSVCPASPNGILRSFCVPSTGPGAESKT